MRNSHEGKKTTKKPISLSCGILALIRQLGAC